MLRISNKIKFRKPSKSLSNKPQIQPEFKKTVPQLARFAIQASKSGFLTRNQLEAGRIVLKRRSKKFNGKVFVLIKPDRIVTKRALETRMGRGKGAPINQIALINKGQLLYEVGGPPLEKMKLIFQKMRQKISVPTVLIITSNVFTKF